jgi:hypothetical protein
MTRRLAITFCAFLFNLDFLDMKYIMQKENHNYKCLAKNEEKEEIKKKRRNKKFLLLLEIGKSCSPVYTNGVTIW